MVAQTLHHSGPVNLHLTDHDAKLIRLARTFGAAGRRNQKL
jgi:hypothetical protein